MPSAIDLDKISVIGTGLRRPECVLAHASGLLIAPDWTEPGGVSLVAPSGRARRLLATHPSPGVETPVRANGIALEEGGTLLLAHLGESRGGVYRLHADGRCALVTDRAGDLPMPPANFVLPDKAGRIWITVSTTKVPRAEDYRPDAASGLVALHEDDRTRVLAEGLGYANECALSPDGGTLYVNETFARRTSAFRVALDGALSERRTVAAYGPGTFPDGLALAEDGSLFITSIVSNRVIRVFPDGAPEVLIEDADPAHLAWVEKAFRGARMGRPHLDTVPSRKLRNISNLAFGGPELDRLYLGCLLGDGIATCSSPVPGVPPVHWRADLGPLAAYLEEDRT